MKIDGGEGSGADMESRRENLIEEKCAAKFFGFYTWKGSGLGPL